MGAIMEREQSYIDAARCYEHVGPSRVHLSVTARFVWLTMAALQRCEGMELVPPRVGAYRLQACVQLFEGGAVHRRDRGLQPSAAAFPRLSNSGAGARQGNRSAVRVIEEQ